MAVPAVTVGFCDPFEKPTIDSGNESIVATNAIFIRGGEVENVMGPSHENGCLSRHDKSHLDFPSSSTCFEKPRMNPKCKFIMATGSLFSDSPDPK